MFYLEVNGLAATGYMSRQKALAAAERGHADRPDAVVFLMKDDRKTGKAVTVQKLY
jgi:hypothetical protein